MAKKSNNKGLLIINVIKSTDNKFSIKSIKAKHKIGFDGLGFLSPFTEMHTFSS